MSHALATSSSGLPRQPGFFREPVWWLFLPAARASSVVNWWALPLTWLALPPMLAMVRRCSIVMDAKPRRDFGLSEVGWEVLMRSS